MDDNEGGWKALKRAKAKKQTEAERLFHQYCDPKPPGWEDREWEILKEAALKILSSEFAEFIEENGLKGHPLHKKIYQADVGQLIIALVEYAHFNRIINLPYLPPDVISAEIIKEFDEHFRWVSEILQIAGVRNIADSWCPKRWYQNPRAEMAKKIIYTGRCRQIPHLLARGHLGEDMAWAR
ncbi:MAG: hypothetical protein FJ121_13590 [Deltaproteobacteria bacterium]|nr:hypothetical protein [Deltaproteobacteria bacterium]